MCMLPGAAVIARYGRQAVHAKNMPEAVGEGEITKLSSSIILGKTKVFSSQPGELLDGEKT